MRLGIVVNNLLSKNPGRTTYLIAREAYHRGHEVWLTTPQRISYTTDDRLEASARTLPLGNRYSVDEFNRELRSDAAVRQSIELHDLDVLLLRNNPTAQKEYVRAAMMQFANFTSESGVVVLPEPVSLSIAANKLYLSNFPDTVRPRTLVTRELSRINEMLDDEGTIILKPLAGYGGRGVFIVHKSDKRNLERIVQSITRDGYVIAQEYLPEAVHGDVRLFMINGRPLVHHQKYALVRRARSGDDIRSNVYVGGRVVPAEMTEEMHAIAEVVGPRLRADRMFLVGLDIVGNRLMEINVFSPGGIHDINRFQNVDFEEAIVDGIIQQMEQCPSYVAGGAPIGD